MPKPTTTAARRCSSSDITEAALASIDKAIHYKGDDAATHASRGGVLSILGRYDEALAAYDKAIALKPDQANIAGDRLHAKSHICDWAGLDAECDRFIRSIRNQNTTTPPFPVVSPALIGRGPIALRHAMDREGPSTVAKTSAGRGERYHHDRIRVGYFSSDFCNHATAEFDGGDVRVPRPLEIRDGGNLMVAQRHLGDASTAGGVIRSVCRGPGHQGR